MKKYHLFSGEDHYPEGGLEDYYGSYETLEEAKAAGEESNDDWTTIAMTQEDGSLKNIAFFIESDGHDRYWKVLDDPTA